MRASDSRLDARSRRLRAGALCLTLVLMASWAHAEESEQVRRLRLQMRQLQQQQMDLQDQQQRTSEENAKLQATLKSVQGEAGAQKSAAVSAGRKVRALSAQVTDLSKQRDDLTAQVADLQKQLAELKAVSADQAQKLAALGTAHQALQRAQARCVDDNAQLYALGGDLLKRYENKGLGDVLAVKEPFTQIARVKLENLGQSYRDKLDDLRVQAQPLPGPAAQP